MRVTWCGLGRMGTAMAAHVLAAGHELTVWNRTPGRGAALVAAGARQAETLADAVPEAEVVVVMLFGPDSVREVLPTICTHAAPGTRIVDATTVGPAAAHEFAATARAAGMTYLDAPVAGSVQPATAGTLGVLVGGDPADVAAVRPLLALWGDPDRVHHVGPVGAGSAAKLVINLTLGVAMSGLGEALALGRQLGVDPAVTATVLAAGPLGWTLGQKREMLADDHYEPATFSLELLAKDLDLCVAEDGDLEVTATVARQARAAIAAGLGGQDYAALAGYLRRTLSH